MWKIKKTKQEEEDEEEEDDDDEYEYASAGVCDNDDYDETVGNVESNKETEIEEYGKHVEDEQCEDNADDEPKEDEQHTGYTHKKSAKIENMRSGKLAGEDKAIKQTRVSNRTRRMPKVFTPNSSENKVYCLCQQENCGWYIICNIRHKECLVYYHPKCVGYNGRQRQQMLNISVTAQMENPTNVPYVRSNKNRKKTLKESR